MPHPRYSGDEIVRRGQMLYEQKIRAEVEVGNKGKFLVINVETGDYEMDADDIAAGLRAKAGFPQAALFSMRVGYPAAYRFGHRFTKTSSR
jgi:hypothetical protein